MIVIGRDYPSRMLLRDLTNEALFAWRRDEAIAYCPRCKSTNVKDSLYRVHDILSLLAGFRPIRCVCCHNRFRVWRFFGEAIQQRPEPGMEMVLIRHFPPVVVGRVEAAERAAAVAAEAAVFRELAVPHHKTNDLAGSLLNLFNATSQHGAGIRTNRPLFRKRIVEADFSASLACAAMAVARDGQSAGEPVNTPSGFRPPTGPENRRKADRPPMHMASRPPISGIRTSPPLARPPVASPSTQDEFATIRR